MRGVGLRAEAGRLTCAGPRLRALAAPPATWTLRAKLVASIVGAVRRRHASPPASSPSLALDTFLTDQLDAQLHGVRRPAPAAMPSTTGLPRSGDEVPSARDSGAAPGPRRRLPARCRSSAARAGARNVARTRCRRGHLADRRRRCSTVRGAGLGQQPQDGRPRRRPRQLPAGRQPVPQRPGRHRRDRAADRAATRARSTRARASSSPWSPRSACWPSPAARRVAGRAAPCGRCDRVAATATRVSQLPLDRGEVALAERVPAADTDARTEVGQVGRGPQPAARPRRRRARRPGTRARSRCASSSPTPATSCARRWPPSAGTPS